MAICEKCIKQSVCKLCDGTEIMGCIEFVSLNKVIENGQSLPDDCEILTREAYADLCMRASEGQEPNCSEIPTGSEKLSSELEKNSKKLEKDFGESDCISRTRAIERLKLNLPISQGADNSRDRHRYMQALADIQAIREMPSVTPQEPILDKIRAEIEARLCDVVSDYTDGYRTAIQGVLAILDKYKGESEG